MISLLDYEIEQFAATDLHEDKHRPCSSDFSFFISPQTKLGGDIYQHGCVGA